MNRNNMEVYMESQQRYYQSLARSRTEDLDQYQSQQCNLSKYAQRENSQEAPLEESSSAQIIRKIVQDLVDLQHQIIGGKCSPIGGSNGVTNDASTNDINTVGQMIVNGATDMESVIMRATDPIEIEGEEIVVNGQRGIWANRMETATWKGEFPLEAYPINQDPNPELIVKKSKAKLEFVQEMAIRYLRPPTPPAPGEIIIHQDPPLQPPPMPPIIIRQQPARPATPEPLVIREYPPRPPPAVGRKVITISGKKLPPPPRKVIIERLAPLPSKPQAVIIERWLPYSQVKRKVVFCPPEEKEESIVVKPRNIIIQWESPQVSIKKEYKYLGVIKANPVEYINRYGDSLTKSSQLPHFVREIKNPRGLVLAADLAEEHQKPHELYGDLHALAMVDLEREGLGEYRDQLNRMGIRNQATIGASTMTPLNRSTSTAGLLPSESVLNNHQPVNAQYHLYPSHIQHLQQHPQQQQTHSMQRQPIIDYIQNRPPRQRTGLSSSSRQVNTSSSASVNHSHHTLNNSNNANNTGSSGYLKQIDEIFNYIDQCQSGSITVEDAEKILLRINSRLGRRYGEDDVRAFFIALDSDGDGLLDLNDFKRAFLTI